MTRICRVTVAAVGLLVGRLVAVRRRLWWLGVPAAAMVLSAGLLATAPAASAVPTYVAGVTLAQVGNDLLMAGQGSSGNVDVLYQPVGSSTWSEVTATAPDTTNPYHPGLAITALTERVGLRQITLIGMADVGPDYSLNFWWQPLADIGSGPWHQEVLSGPETTFTAPSIVQIGNDVAVAAQGDEPTNGGSRLDFYWQQIGATGWNSFLGQEQGLVGSAPSMAVLASPSDTLGITFTNEDGEVYYVQQTPAKFGTGWQGPYTVANGVYNGAAPAPIVALDNNLTAITTPGNNNGLYQWMTPDPPSFVNTTDGAFPGTVDDGISTAQLGNGVVAATTQSSNATLEFYWRLPDGPWHLENLGSADAFNGPPPPVVALTNSAGTQLVATAVENADGSVDFYWQTIGSSSWATIYLPQGTFGT
jgi:hypothetical protein